MGRLDARAYTTHLLPLQRLRVGLTGQVQHRAHGGFHHAARCTEQLRRAGALPQGVVERSIVGQRTKCDAARTDHAGQLARGNHVVHIARHAGACGLVLLGGAGHHAHHIGLFLAVGERRTQGGGKVSALGQGAVHLLR